MRDNHLLFEVFEMSCEVIFAQFAGIDTVSLLRLPLERQQRVHVCESTEP
jgi:hypothetical protein